MHDSASTILEALQQKTHEMLPLIEHLVNIDSGTLYKAGVDRCGAIVADALRELGFVVSTIPETDRGNHLLAERSGSGTKRLFLSAHLDTVCPEGTVARRPFRVDGDLAFGPGVGDMKGGIVQMLYALRVLRETGMETPPISVFLTGDEEMGSVRGRPHIEALAKRSAWVLVMEPSSKPGSVAVRRWGIGSFSCTFRGIGAHVLNPHGIGVNACRELALKILALESLSDPVQGVKVSVNLVSGGRSRQVTAAEAKADVDVRVRDSAQMEEVEARVRTVASTPILPGITTDVSGGMTRPPLEPNAGTETLLRVAEEAAREIGIELMPMEEYGGSDGCFTAALGVPTLDGLGPLTHDMCGDQECIEISSLAPRTALLAGIIARLAREP